MGVENRNPLDELKGLDRQVDLVRDLDGSEADFLPAGRNRQGEPGRFRSPANRWRCQAASGKPGHPVETGKSRGASVGARGDRSFDASRSAAAHWSTHSSTHAAPAAADRGATVPQLTTSCRCSGADHRSHHATSATTGWHGYPGDSAGRTGSAHDHDPSGFTQPAVGRTIGDGPADSGIRVSADAAAGPSAPGGATSASSQTAGTAVSAIECATRSDCGRAGRIHRVHRSACFSGESGPEAQPGRSQGSRGNRSRDHHDAARRLDPH